MHGPPLMLDKCALQSLSRHEAEALPHCFTVNVPPILTLEVLADLKKRKDLVKDKDPQHEVKILADKLLALFDHNNNAHYRYMMKAELHGHKIPMTGSPVLAGGHIVPMSDGASGIVFEEHPDRARYRRWQSGRFTPEDDAEASQWREMSSKLSFEKIKAELMKKAKRLPKASSLKEARDHIDYYFQTAPQFMLLSTMLDWFRFSNKVRAVARHRWLMERPESFEKFAPFCCHVLRVTFMHTIGLSYNLISTKPTNAIDLEYLFYLPFCVVFSSGDKFVIEMSKALIRPYQFFIDRETLKRDMQAIHQYREVTDEVVRVQLLNSFKPGRPNAPFQHPIWGAVTFTPWDWAAKSKQQGSTLTEEEESQQMLKQAHSLMAAFKAGKGRRMS
jgi:hypothetical protein